MSCATERIRRALAPAAALVLGLAAAQAAEPLAPKQLHKDPALLKQLFVEAIGRPVDVVVAEFRAERVQLVVVDPVAPAVFETWTATPRRPVQREEGSAYVACPGQRIALETLDFAAGARVLAQIDALIGANGFDASNVVQARLAGIEDRARRRPCDHLAWFETLSDPVDPLIRVDAEWTLDGTLVRALDRQSRPIPPARLFSGGFGAGRPKTAPPVPAAPPARHDYLAAGIAEELAQIEQRLGAPLALYRLDIYADSLQVTTVDADRRHRVTVWRFDRDREMAAPEAKELVGDDCDRPFALADFGYPRLAELIAAAPRTIAAMPEARVRKVSVSRRLSACRKPPQVSVSVEDERGYGDVVYDAAGQLVEARVR
ncbi:hypothetical protein [Tahibacter caeni]|uniref:hypothetical protein n=1 Tax=Tahibacter caeni TaxID=1453545 RepID=UPI00214950DD|nr:hypothetical protein [Tahibacter caeni]